MLLFVQSIIEYKKILSILNEILSNYSEVALLKVFQLVKLSENIVYVFRIYNKLSRTTADVVQVLCGL